MNDRGIWTTKEELATHLFDESLCDAIITICNSKNLRSIVDIGCGNGSYVKYFKNKGFNCWGYDGSPLTPDFCIIKDFSERINIGKYGLVLSLEVGEHIPVDYEQIFIDNLVDASIGLIILSWAVEGQGGDGHVNCRNNNYVINELTNRGYCYDEATTEFLRDKSTLSWFKDTILTFER